MKRNRKIRLIAFIVVVFSALVGWFFRPYPAIDPLKVHPALRGLEESTECAWTSFGDGGSLFIQLTRPDKTEIFLSLSDSLDHSFLERGQLYVGASHFPAPGATKITGYDHTKYVVAKFLARDLPKDPSIRRKIAILTKRVSDWIFLVVESGPSDAFAALRLR